MGEAKKAQYDHPVKRRDALLIDPDDLVLEDDKDGPLFDPRARLAPDEPLVQLMMNDDVGTELSAILITKEEGRAKVVAGRRRVVAAREANRRLRAEKREPRLLLCLPKTSDSKGLLALMVAENEHRLSDTPLNRARKLQRYLDEGGTMEEAAEVFGTSERTLKSLQALLSCSVKVRTMVEKGNVPLSQARKLAKLQPAEQDEQVEKVKREPKAKGKRKKGEEKTARAKGKGVLEKLRLEAEAQKPEGNERGIADAVRDLLDYLLGRREIEEMNSAFVRRLCEKVE